MISRQADCRFLSYFSKIMLVQYCAKLNFVLAIFWRYLLEILSWMIMMPLHVKQNISFYKCENWNRLGKTVFMKWHVTNLAWCNNTELCKSNANETQNKNEQNLILNKNSETHCFYWCEILQNFAWLYQTFQQKFAVPSKISFENLLQTTFQS